MIPAICVENLGKSYRVNHAIERPAYRTLRDSLIHAVTRPLRCRCDARVGSQTEEFWALKDVSFEVQPGEIVGIIGRNGAGKSTLLKILSRITKPTTGQIELQGRISSLLEVGTGFHPELTGRENIYLNGSILGMSRREIAGRFDEIVAFAETEKFLETPVKRYSSGMYVRLAFAVAAHLQPEILLVDEVLAVGDAGFQSKCLGKLRDVNRDGRTVLFVSHDMNAMTKLTGRALLIEQGRIVAQGDTNEVISKYLKSEACLQPEWIADKVDLRKSLAITAVKIRNGMGHVSPFLNADQPFHIEIDFQVTADIKAQIAFRLNTSRDGSTIFTSALSDPQQERATSFRSGRYRAICRIPQYLLRPGAYHLLVAANNPFGPPFDLIEQVLQFEVTQIGSLVNHDARLGAVVPLLQWDLAETVNIPQAAGSAR